MTILEAIRAEERKLVKQLSKLQGDLEGIRNAARALGHSANREAKTIKKESAFGSRQGKDRSGCQKEMGQGEGASEENDRITGSHPALALRKNRSVRLYYLARVVPLESAFANAP